jgi:hypothetical protein
MYGYLPIKLHFQLRAHAAPPTRTTGGGGRALLATGFLVGLIIIVRGFAQQSPTSTTYFKLKFICNFSSFSFKLPPLAV